MADVDEDSERFCHDLLIKLKKTTEGLLAVHTAQGVWGTYGGLRRICLDAEAILFHGLKRSKASSESGGSFWQFVQGLRHLSPSLAPAFDSLTLLGQSQNLGDAELGQVWLRNSVQDHSLMTQLDILIADEKYMHSFYHVLAYNFASPIYCLCSTCCVKHAFLCQSDYVQAMRICFKAIELGKQALLSEISPHLLRSGQAKISHSRSSSLPVSRAFRLATSGHQPQGCSLPSGMYRSADMGNKHPHLNVAYSSHLSNSNLSLTVDPSLGASSLLYQKTLSDPYFVSSIDSPMVLESLRRDAASEPLRNSQRNQLSALQQNSQPFGRSHIQNQFMQEHGRLDNLPAITGTCDSLLSDQTNHPTEIVVSSSSSNPANLQTLVTTSVEREGHKNPASVLRPYSSFSSDPRTTTQTTVKDVSVAGYSLHNATTGSPTNPFINQNVETTEVKTQNFPLDQNMHPHLSFGNRVAHIQFSDTSGHTSLNSVYSVKGAENPMDIMLSGPGGLSKEGPLLEINIICESPVSRNIGAAAAEVNTCEHSDGSVIPSIAAYNISDNSNRNVVDGSSVVIDSLASTHSVPSSVSSPENGITIKIVPQTPDLPHNLSDPFVQIERGSTEPVQETSALSISTGCSSNPELHSSTTITDTSKRTRPQIVSVKSDPALSISYPLRSPKVKKVSSELQLSFTESTSPGSHSYGPAQPWADADLYIESMVSPGSSPVNRNLPNVQKSSGGMYIPHTLVQGTSLDPSPSALSGSTHNGSGSKHVHPPSVAATRKMGHKRWVSDTSTIRVVDHFQQTDSSDPSFQNRKAGSEQQGAVNQVSQSNGRTRRRASEFEPQSYQGTLTKPVKGQSLMSYLTSQDFNTCANLEKENAHFRICEALIEAFESMKFNRMMKRQETGKSGSSTDSSSDEEIQELRQRIRIRKREKMMAKGRPFPSLSDGQTDTATTSQTASSPFSSQHEFSSSFSGESESDEDSSDGRNIDLTMSSDSHGNLAVVKSSGLTLSLASLYSDAELQRSNQQIEKTSSYEESTNPGSAESIAISLLRKFSEKHLPKASELKWLVSECDAPQRLLPLPASTPVSPDDAEYADLLTTNRTRLRGNLEWAPPRAQIIFSVHPPEKRANLMSRQNFRCAGCGNRVDPAFVKRYRYCEYLGKYFCQCCHTGETSIIPGRVIEKWDFSRYPIANFSYSLLDKMWAEPLFHVDTINPSLYKRVRGLENIRECRRQLVHLHSLLAVCKRDPVLLKEVRKMPPHWVSNDDAYSMEDFTQVRSGTMLNRIKSFISLAVAHVNDCQLCQGLGFICGMCQDPQVIFPFQLDSVIRCPVCQACYHKECFILGKCPKCIRLEARRKLLQEPLSPDSPDSGENAEDHSKLQNIEAESIPSPVASSADDCR